MNIFNTLTLIGKVLILISIILIFSIVNTKQAYLDKVEKNKKKYNNKPEDEEFSILEGYTNKMKKVANSEYFDGTCKIKISSPIYFIFKLLGYLLTALIWLWVNLLRDPVALLLEKALGKYYVYVKKTFSLIFKFYRLIIKYSFKIIRFFFKIIYRIIDIIFRILFRLLDFAPIIKDIMAYILAIPFLVFTPLYEWFAFSKYFAVICWSEGGFVNDIVTFFGLSFVFITDIDVDELEKSASFEEDVETSAKNTTKDFNNANKEADEDSEKLKDDSESF
jgi:hypothetical protein